MSEEAHGEVGVIRWVDLTVPDAEGVRDFYSEVVGWDPDPIDMGGYYDFNMAGPETGSPMAGICHHKGVNKGIPPQWMVYITVENLDTSLDKVVELGGEVLVEKRASGEPGGFAVIRDPAGAVAALYQPA